MKEWFLIPHFFVLFSALEVPVVLDTFFKIRSCSYKVSSWFGRKKVDFFVSDDDNSLALRLYIKEILVEFFDTYEKRKPKSREKNFRWTKNYIDKIK